MDSQKIQMKLQELAERRWDLPAIEARCKAFAFQGIPRKNFNRDEIIANREQILDRVQRRGEEYNFFAGNCARGSALAVMEEFGFGSMEVVKALSAFPGFGGTGWMCGALSGGLVALGLFAGSEDLQNHDAMRAAMIAAKQLMARFENEAGGVTCRKIQEDVVFGRYMDPGASPVNLKAFEQAKGFEKCSMLPGIGARIAAEIIMESICRAEK
ncbi:MAG: putative redox-active protein [Firmicutes bacterium]|nr:putative redox-active protein [Bacillota bacterium]